MRAREFIRSWPVRATRSVAVGAGVVLITIGLVKKVALADYLAREVVDPVFGVPEAYAAPDVAGRLRLRRPDLLRLLGLHRHRDRGGAADGFVFPQNFNSPYRAIESRDFWRRWHMTLSRFLRDFLYIPLVATTGAS